MGLPGPQQLCLGTATLPVSVQQLWKPWRAAREASRGGGRCEAGCPLGLHVMVIVLIPASQADWRPRAAPAWLLLGWAWSFEASHPLLTRQAQAKTFQSSPPTNPTGHVGLVLLLRGPGRGKAHPLQPGRLQVGQEGAGPGAARATKEIWFLEATGTQRERAAWGPRQSPKEQVMRGCKMPPPRVGTA